MNQVRIYISDESMLAGKLKFKLRSEREDYTRRAKDRIAEIARITARRMRDGS